MLPEKVNIDEVEDIRMWLPMYMDEAVQLYTEEACLLEGRKNSIDVFNIMVYYSIKKMTERTPANITTISKVAEEIFGMSDIAIRRIYSQYGYCNPNLDYIFKKKIEKRKPVLDSLETHLYDSGNVLMLKPIDFYERNMWILSRWGLVKPAMYTGKLEWVNKQSSDRMKFAGKLVTIMGKTDDGRYRITQDGGEFKYHIYELTHEKTRTSLASAMRQLVQIAASKGYNLRDSQRWAKKYSRCETTTRGRCVKGNT